MLKNRIRDIFKTKTLEISSVNIKEKVILL